jgi:hypothetical protein
MRTTHPHLASLGVLAVLPACAQIPLHANLTDAELHQRLEENFTPGMTRGQVEAKLDELKVSGKTRLWYDEAPGGAPPQLLVRLYEAGGFWLDESDQIVEWVDTVFVFGRQTPKPLYERAETFRRHQRYFHGEPVNIPETPTKYAWGDYPLPPPPPARPLVLR